MNLKMRIKAGWGALVGLAFAMASSPAFADNGLLFTPVDGDKSISLVLGKVYGTLFNGAQVPTEAAFGVLNGCALLVGGFITFYMLITGTMMTAHDGEGMGRKWSGVWVPIRTAIATAMLVPVSGGISTGYCTAQLFMAWVITNGVGVADTTWTAYAQANFSTEGMQPQTQIPNVDELALAMLKSQVCMAAANAISVKDPSAASTVPSDFSATDIDGGAGRNYGSPTLGVSVCGSVFYSTPVAADPAAAAASGSAIDSAFVTGITKLNPFTGQASALRAYHIQAARQMESDLAVIAQGIVAGKPPAASSLTAAITKYQNTVSAGATSLFGSTNAFSEVAQSASRDGWVAAGSWFTKMSALQDASKQAVAMVPSVSAPTFSTTLSDVNAAYAALEGFHNKASSFGMNDPQGKDDTSSGPLGKLIRSIGKGFNSAIFHAIQVNPNRNGLMSVKDIGDGIEAGGNIAVVGGVGMMLVAELAGGATEAASKGFITNPRATLTTLGNLLLLLALPVLILGSFMGTILPMMPFLLFFGAFVGWVLLVAESLIAAPLWILMHLRPDGDGATGGNQAGYMLLMGVALRPLLIVLGFITSYTVLDPLLQLFNMMFLPSFQSGMSESLIGISATIAMAGMYFGAVFTLIKTVFGFTHQIGDQVLRWMGGGHEQMGQAASALAEGGRGGAMIGIQNFQQGGKGAMPSKDKPGGKPDSTGNGRGASESASDSMGANVAMKERNSSASDSMGVGGGDDSSGGGLTAGGRGGSSGESSGGDSTAGGGGFGGSSATAGSPEEWAAQSVQRGRGVARRERGQLVASGSAPYRHEEGAPETNFATIRTASGGESTHWGKDLGSALERAGVEKGDWTELAQLEAREGADGKKTPRKWVASKFEADAGDEESEAG